MRISYRIEWAVFLLAGIMVSYVQSSVSAPLPFSQTPLFTSSGNCVICHVQLADETGQDVSIDAHWRSTMMANAARDPFFQAKVRSEIERFPELIEIIENKCSTCHMPMARTQSVAGQEDVAMFGDGYTSAGHEYHTLAMDGVSCTLCHQIQDIHLGEDDSYSGGYVIDALKQSPDRSIYGPFDNPFTNNMRNMGFTPVHSGHIQNSKLCATCHTLFTPVLDENKNIVGEFPEQTVYLEWEQSEYGEGKSNVTHCRQCHMPVANGAVRISQTPKNLKMREPFSMHHFVGGNAFMISLINQKSSELNATAEVEHFDATLERTLNQLQQRTARIEIIDSHVTGDLLAVNLSVLSMTGHKFPAGFPSRRVWIHCTVLNGDGEVFFESGKPLESGAIAGNDADTDLLAYEPHYQVITEPGQVQIYESIMHDTQDRVTYTLLFAASYLKDNRLLPSGFNKESASPDTVVHGQALADGDFTGGMDSIQYAVDIENQPGPYTVQAELLYQTIAYPFIADLNKDTGGSGLEMIQFYNETDKTPVRIDSVSKEGIDRQTEVEQWRQYGSGSFKDKTAGY